MSILLQDLRYGVRMLARTPVVSIVAALSLALGITAATSTFALASAFFLEPLPFGEQDGLVIVRQIRPGDSEELAAGVSIPNYRDLQQATPAFSGMTAFADEYVNLTGLDQPERVQVVSATPDFFDVLQIAPRLGRGFRPEEGGAGAGRVIVLSHAFWETRFNSEPGVLGRSVELDGQPHTIIGVMPESFEMLPANTDALRATDYTADENRAGPNYLVFGRLRAGATLAQASGELTAAFTRLESEYPDANRNWTLLVQKAREFFPGPTDAKLIMVLVVVSLFAVGIACANVANLLLGRAEMRMKEVAVRSALGAGRLRVLRQLLTESLLLALVAGGLGILFSVYAVAGLRSAMPPVLPRAFLPVLDLPTLIAAVVIAMGAGILFGLAPALHATGGSLRDILGDASRGGTAGRRRKRLRSVFVIGEVAVALALLTGAGFLLEASNALVNADSGFNADGLITFQVTLPENRYAGDADVVRFQEDAVRALNGISGVQSAAVMGSLPRSMSNRSARFHIEGTPEVDASERPLTRWQAVNPEYFATLGISLVTGRLTGAEDRAETRLVAVVSRAFADAWTDGAANAIGRRVEILGQPREVVGIVTDIMQSRAPLGDRLETQVYLPFAQHPVRNPAFALRSVADPATLAPDIRAALATVDPDQPIAQLRTLNDHIRESVAGPRVLGIFVLSLGALAMVLAAIGIYGVMAHTVIQARREIGIRMAVGARESQVVGMVTRNGLLLTGIGLVLGLPLAWLVYLGVVSSLNLFAIDLSANYAAGAAAMLGAVALFASWLPARRAARVQPSHALQNE